MASGTPPGSLWGTWGSQDPWDMWATRGRTQRSRDKARDAQVWRLLTSSAGCTWLSAWSTHHCLEGQGTVEAVTGVQGGPQGVQGLPWPVQSPTSRSAIKASSVLPEQWLTVSPQPWHLWGSTGEVMAGDMGT